MILLLLLLFTATAYAQQCLPTDWEHPPELRGCPSILKVVKTDVTFPGNSPATVVQFGRGQCGHLTDCNLLMYPFLGNKECWPEFKSPERSYGVWRRTVVNYKAEDAMIKTCEKEGVYYPLIGPRCTPENETTDRVERSCPTAGGPTQGVTVTNTPWPTLDPGPDPCYWSFLSGIPCWAWQPSLY